jgi:hypothetical protein
MPIVFGTGLHWRDTGLGQCNTWARRHIIRVIHFGQDIQSIPPTIDLHHDHNVIFGRSPRTAGSFQQSRFLAKEWHSSASR